MITKIAFNIKGLTTYLFRISREEEKKFHFYRAIEEERERKKFSNFCLQVYTNYKRRSI
jgi:hypothetical protein